MDESRCNSRLEEDGEIVKCDLPIGHTGRHERGSWEWWDFTEESNPEQF